MLETGATLGASAAFWSTAVAVGTVAPGRVVGTAPPAFPVLPVALGAMVFLLGIAVCVLFAAFVAAGVVVKMGAAAGPSSGNRCKTLQAATPGLRRPGAVQRVNPMR